ncbi:hypothetical protein CRG98_040657 [Punica granatum]|uniref:Uncharacterized protein n=1 Tax=Punica granatum TaxID=22663 RepID=A0A2I0I4L8_PUNGR|nr:hypothetical protein CRG98_040657 [Punica granatum]
MFINFKSYRCELIEFRFIDLGARYPPGCVLDPLASPPNRAKSLSTNPCLPSLGSSIRELATPRVGFSTPARTHPWVLRALGSLGHQPVQTRLATLIGVWVLEVRAPDPSNFRDLTARIPQIGGDGAPPLATDPSIGVTGLV